MGWACGIVYWFGVCYWIQFVLSFHGGLGDPLGWAVFMLFCLAKALHMAVFALLAGILMRRWWAMPAVAALWVAIEVTHGPLGFAWLALGNAGIDMGVPLRLAPLTGVYGLSFVFAAMSAAIALIALRRPRHRIAVARSAAIPHFPLANARRAPRPGDRAAGAAEYFRNRASGPPIRCCASKTRAGCPQPCAACWWRDSVRRKS